jgi:hypothetical protein
VVISGGAGRQKAIPRLTPTRPPANYPHAARSHSGRRRGRRPRCLLELGLTRKFFTSSMKRCEHPSGEQNSRRNFENESGAR